MQTRQAAWGAPVGPGPGTRSGRETRRGSCSQEAKGRPGSPRGKACYLPPAQRKPCVSRWALGPLPCGKDLWAQGSQACGSLGEECSGQRPQLVQRPCGGAGPDSSERCGCSQGWRGPRGQGRQGRGWATLRPCGPPERPDTSAEGGGGLQGRARVVETSLTFLAVPLWHIENRRKGRKCVHSPCPLPPPPPWDTGL